MFQTCPKCAHVRKESETNDPGTCPACGLIFAKYVEAQRNPVAAGYARNNGHSSAGKSDRSGRNFLMLFPLLVVIAVALGWYQYKQHHDRRAVVSMPKAAVTDGNGKSIVLQREFAELFDSDTALRNLAREGRYTIVEVYLDQCAYCRELEAALDPLGEKRSDIAVVRVHHPGHMNMSISGSSQEEEATALIVEQSLKDLGYQVDAVADTLFVEGGVVHFRRQAWGDYMVRMRVDAKQSAANFNVIRAVTGASNERSVLDHIAEDRWCAEFPALLKALELRGVRLNVTRRLEAGELPVQLVDAAKLPTFAEEEATHFAAKPMVREMK